MVNLLRAGIKIRSLEAKDADVVARLSYSAPEAGNWAAWDYERLVELGMAGWVAVRDQQIVGFVVARCAASELEILNVVIAKEFRRAGAATALLAACFDRASQRGAHKAFLEVRESNHAAISLYRREGFHISGRRVQYYHNPDEDALLMTRVLP
jgi:ribosomal-protein-alanine N-acetyltransferase